MNRRYRRPAQIQEISSKPPNFAMIVNYKTLFWSNPILKTRMR